jgi:hypothetical protein
VNVCPPSFPENRAAAAPALSCLPALHVSSRRRRGALRVSSRKI